LHIYAKRAASRPAKPITPTALTFSAALDDLEPEAAEDVAEPDEPELELGVSVAEEPEEAAAVEAEESVEDESEAEVVALLLELPNELASPTMPPWTSDGELELLVEPAACVYASRVSPEAGALMTMVMPLWQCLA